MASDDPYRYVLEGRFEKALEAFDTPASIAFYGVGQRGRLLNKGMTLLALNRILEAVDVFIQAETVYREPVSSRSPRSELGGAFWLCGREREALGIWREDVDALLQGQMDYADASGGGGCGLLLLFAATRLKSSSDREKARQLFKKILKSKRAVTWPGPLISCLENPVLEHEVLKNRFGTNNVSELSKKLTMKGFERRERTEAMFYLAIAKEIIGNTVGSAQLIADACAIPNPLSSIEWYIARSEVQQGASKK